MIEPTDMYLLHYVRYTANAQSLCIEKGTVPINCWEKNRKRFYGTVFCQESVNIWAGFYTDIIFLACHFSELMIIQL